MSSVARTVAPADFFERLLPAVIRQRRQLAKRLGGVYAFEIPEEGAWTVDLGAGSVRAGLDGAGDVRVVITAADFASLLANRMTLERVHVSGDASLLGKLSVLLRSRGMR